MSVAKLKEVALILEDAIEVKDRQRHLRMFRKSFIAKEAFWWLILNKQCGDERGALVLGNQLLEAGFIQNLSRPKKDKSFENNRDMFRFCSKMVPHRFSEVFDSSVLPGLGDDDAAGLQAGGGGGQIPEESEVGDVSTTAMFHNPLRTMGGGSISSTASSADGRGRGTSLVLSPAAVDGALFGVSGESSTDQVAEAEVETYVTREMQRGVKSLQQLNANFVRDFGEETFFTWRDVIKQIYFKYAGPVSRLLARIADQGTEIKALDDTANVNDAKLVWLEGVIAAMTAAVKRTMDVAAQWDVPPESYSILAEEKLKVEAVATAESMLISNATRDVLREAALVGQRDKRARSEAHKDAAAAAAAVATVSSPAAPAAPAAARDRTSSGLPEMRRRSSAMKSVGSRQGAQTTFAAFKDVQSRSFRKKATDAAAAAVVTATPSIDQPATPTGSAKPAQPAKPSRPLANPPTPDKHRVRKDSGVVDRKSPLARGNGSSAAGATGLGGIVDEEEEEEPDELPSWTRPQRMDSGTLQNVGTKPQIGIKPTIKLKPMLPVVARTAHSLSGVFEEEVDEKDAKDAGDSASSGNVPFTSFRATGAPVRPGRADSGTLQRKVTKRKKQPPRHVAGIGELGEEEQPEE